MGRPWFHISQGVALDVVQVLLPFGQDTLTKGSLEDPNRGHQYQGALNSGVPGSSICHLVTISTYKARDMYDYLKFHLNT
jgi:hypothetical protein